MSAENFEQNYLSMNPKNVGAEINQLQRTLEIIVQPYQRPIASILPEERRVEISLLFDDTDLEECYDRFSSWEGSLSKKKVRDWLNQFETNLDKNIAYLILSKFQFFSKNDIEAATQSLQSKLINFLLDKEHLREAFYSDPKAPIKNEAELQKWLRNKVIRYARLPSPPNTSVESQDIHYPFFINLLKIGHHYLGIVKLQVQLLINANELTVSIKHNPQVVAKS
jgi:hypothetical protein